MGCHVQTTHLSSLQGGVLTPQLYYPLQAMNVYCCSKLVLASCVGDATSVLCVVEEVGVFYGFSIQDCGFFYSM